MGLLVALPASRAVLPAVWRLALLPLVCCSSQT
jgi:hypothetical protein